MILSSRKHYLADRFLGRSILPPPSLIMTCIQVHVILWDVKSRHCIYFNITALLQHVFLNKYSGWLNSEKPWKLSQLLSKVVEPRVQLKYIYISFHKMTGAQYYCCVAWRKWVPNRISGWVKLHVHRIYRETCANQLKLPTFDNSRWRAGIFLDSTIHPNQASCDY